MAYPIYLKPHFNGLAGIVRQIPVSTHMHPLRDVCVHNMKKITPPPPADAMGFRVLLRKQKCLIFSAHL